MKFAYILGCLLLEISLGFIISLILNSKYVPYGKRIVSLIIAPSLSAPVVVGLMWLFLLNDEVGLIPYYLDKLKLLQGISILGTPSTAGLFKKYLGK